ncbi:threonine--tRNA ligase [Lujinxingia vulgaris]|uniref:Threonine--tRNA ligase n=2 Tax=Lujinxingia vulgaris TaxID=2600176 RepID=A0A5C6X2F9_9DELT|nr:threonine--tRNA ligase [Lujinxingia vulgaris]
MPAPVDFPLAALYARQPFGLSHCLPRCCALHDDCAAAHLPHHAITMMIDLLPQESPMAEAPNDKRADKLYRVRHSTAHLMAAAILEMFPDARLAIGPPIKDGFYYDFELPRALSPDDFEEIEERMTKLVKSNVPFKYEEWDKDKAREFFKDQPYKLELIEGIEGDTVSTYESGPLIDLCAGPHVRYSKQCKNFKLLKVAGAYWRGDENKPMLQRVYGTAFPTRDELDQYLHMLEEAKRRDHRKLARELELFDFNRLSPGSIFWRPKGWTSYRELQNYFREIEAEQGYEEISNPLIYHEDLFAQSGHLEHYQDTMFKLEAHGQTYCLKPMNCPDTMLYFKSKKRSYRELPLRVAEFGHLHRNELPGALGGATRVRQFCQDDAHIFTTEEHITQEISMLLELVERTYGMFNMEYDVEISTRPDDFMGEVELWDKAEGALKEALEAAGKPYTINEGDGAFYGPKIDFQVRDCLGRSWQCATIQLDFQLPRRFELTYTASDNAERTPIVIHRAIAGSLERFFAILVEHLAGAFPTWLAPVQAVIVPITDEQNDYAWEVARDLKRAGVRVEVDDRSEKMGFKIREAETKKIPYMLVIGGREAEAHNVALRTYKDGRRGTLPLAEVKAEILDRIANRTLDVDVQVSGLATIVEDAPSGEDMAERGY